MSQLPDAAHDREEIVVAIQRYLDGAKSGLSADMKPAFHEQATMFGFEGSDFVAGPIQRLFDWLDSNGPAPEVESRIAGIDVADSIATVRLELDNWSGYRFTDMFTLLKIEGQWKIMNKVFHIHGT